MRGRPAIGNNGLGQFKERGLKRVPLEGPPTRITAFDSDIPNMYKKKKKKLQSFQRQRAAFLKKGRVMNFFGGRFFKFQRAFFFSQKAVFNYPKGGGGFFLKVRFFL